MHLFDEDSWEAELTHNTATAIAASPPLLDEDNTSCGLVKQVPPTVVGHNVWSE